MEMTAIHRTGGLCLLGLAVGTLLGLAGQSHAGWPAKKPNPTTGRTAPPQYQGRAPSQYFPSRDPRAAGRTPYNAAATARHAEQSSPRFDASISRAGYTTRQSTAAHVNGQGYDGSVVQSGYEGASDNVVPVSAQIEQYSAAPGVVMEGAGISHPVEIISDGTEDSAPCLDCVTTGPTLCDPNFYDKGCNRPRCPCPSEEALSYYRCNFWGHYPTFWRSWPEDFQRYRPELANTYHDRFRKGEAGQPGAYGMPGADADLDEQLQEMLRQQQGLPGAPGQPPPSSTQPPTTRPEPELLPEDAIHEQPLPPSAAPQDRSQVPPNTGRWSARSWTGPPPATVDSR